MNIFSFLVTGVFAAELLTTNPISTPKNSFGKLMATPTPAPTTAPAVLGTTTFIGPVKPQPKADRPLAETKKSSVTIALLGDSMMDTLGTNAPALQTALKKIYPRTTFIIKNYGVGGTNIQYGIERITNGYTYLGTSYAPLVASQPDIVVVESFGYNPFGSDSGTIDAHWLLLAKTVDTIKANLPNAKIVMAATIAPNANRFGDGAPGLSFSVLEKWQRTTTIKKYLENTVRFAEGEHLPLADAYHPSLMADGNGNLSYINGGDHIHYSDKGRVLMATQIAGAIAKNKLLE